MPTSMMRNLIFFLFALTSPGCGGQANGGDDESTEETNEISADINTRANVIVDAEFGQWQSELPSDQMLESLNTQGERVPAMAATPTASSVEDLQRHMLGNTIVSEMRRDEIEAFIYRTFQQVPGVPLDPRYEDDRFDVVRQGFSQQCRNSVSGYQHLLVNTLSQSYGNFAGVLRDAQVSLVATSYETECLTSLSNVPLDVRRVLGVLAVGPASFCSATIIGPEKILTSRHCFVDPTDGNELTYLKHWKDGNVSFIPAVPQNSRYSFKLQEPEAELLTRILDSFSVESDYLVANTTRTMEFAAVYEQPPSDASQYPIAAWLVGSNVNLDDVGNERAPLEFVRGSAPTACAVLERSAAGCLYHTCQSSKSTSGAGILVPDSNGTVKLIGVHKGTVAEAAGCEATPPMSLRMNFGITDLFL